MLKIQEIREIIKLIDQSNIDEFSYEQDGGKIKMKKHKNVIEVQNVASQTPTTVMPLSQPVVQSAPVTASQPNVEKSPKVEEAKVEESSHLHKIVSPMVGTFYAASSPEAEAFVKVGDKVNPSKVVCIVEAMKLFNEIEAEVSGEIVEVLVKNGQLVEYGQPLFLVKE